MSGMASKESIKQGSGRTLTPCAIRVEKVVSQMEGDEQANVNLAIERLTVEYDKDALEEADFREKIEKLGYGVVEEQAEFDVTGMTCSACANRVEKGVNRMPGVSAANVN